VITNSGEQEELKTAIHAAMLGLSVLCLGYNVMAFARRRETHLARNIALYGALTAVEAIHVRHHLMARRMQSSSEATVNTNEGA
jgi:hypothetical protein